MKTILMTTSRSLELEIVPDADAHCNGHAILTYSYNIYIAGRKKDPAITQSKESVLHLQAKHDPTYLGVINFEQPGQVFSYVTDGIAQLSPDEIEEVVEMLKRFRGTPKMWTID